MKTAVKYFFLRLKCAVRVLPFVLAISLLICLGLGVILGTLVELDANDQSKQMLNIGIVGDTSDEYLSMGITAVKSFDASRFSINFEEMTAEQAAQKLSRGELTAYIVIPDGFVDGIMYGDIQRIEYVSSAESVGIAAMFKQEISAMVSRMVVESQKGVYGMNRLMRANAISGISNQTDAMNLRYFSLIFNRTSFIVTEDIGVSDGLSFAGYMTCGILVLFLLLIGISCCPLFIKRDLSLSQLLSASGQNAAMQVSAEYLAFFLTMLINVCVLTVSAFLTAGGLLSRIPELQGITVSSLPSLIVTFLPPLLTVTALQFLLYELASGIVSGVLLQFLSAVSLGYISGCFYPVSFLPAGIRAVAQFTPSGIARQYISARLSSQQATVQLFALLGMVLVFLALAAAVRKYRIRRL